MDQGNAIAIALIALALGALIGWLFGSRSGAAAREVIESLRLQLNGVRDERDKASADHDVTRTTLSETRSELAAMNASHDERVKSLESQIARLTEAGEEMSAKFSQVGGTLLTDARNAFLKQADEKFAEAEKSNKAKIELLLQPLKETLTRYESGLKEMEHARKGAYDGLTAQILMLRDGQDKVASEALRLRTALRSSTGGVGRWGEEQCRNVLEQAGLQEGIDFEAQVSTDQVGDRGRPDFLVSVPGNRKIIIDVKCSLDSYIGATETDDETLKEKLLDDHAKAIRAHAQGLMKKSYQDKFSNAASFVVMFVPGENFLHAALQRDRKLLSYGQNGNVIIVGPTNLISLVLNVASIRDQAKLAERAEHIGKIGRRLYEGLSTLGKNAHAMSKSIHSMVANWNQLVGTLDGNMLSAARKFDELGVGKNSEGVRELTTHDSIIREPQRLIAEGIASKPDFDDPDELSLTKLVAPKSANEDDAAA